MPNIIDSIQISSSTFDVRDKSATTVVNLTQEEYDNLPSSAKTANVLYNITDATAGDLSQYWTSAQTQSAITQATSGLQETLSAGTGIDITDNVISATGGGGGITSGEVQSMIDDSISGKADTTAVTQDIAAAVSGKLDTSTFETYSGNVETALSGKQDTLSAGTNITIVDNVISATGGGGKAVSGGTNISITTGETADTINCILNLENGTNSESGGIKLKSSVAGNTVSGRDAAAFGGANKSNGINSFVTGFRNTGNTTTAFVSGTRNQTTNTYEALFGIWALSNGSRTGEPNGYSDATLFAVGNGDLYSQTKHNAFDIRQNGDIYIADTNDTSTTNWYQKPMIKLQDALGGGGGITSGEVQSMIDESISGKTDESAFTAHTGDSTIHVTTTQTAAWDAKSNFSGSYNDLTDKPTIPTSTSAVTSGSTDVITSGGVYQQMGGLKLVKLTQAQYDALTTKDSNTLYVING